MRYFFLVVSLSFYVINIQAQDIGGTIIHDGIERNYLLHLPDEYDATETYPLVFNLHGYTSNAIEQRFYSNMNVTSNSGGFIVCYPNGIGESWNVGLPLGSSADDVGFIENLIDSLALDYSVNLERVYSCGMSNGGFMSYKLACELGDKIAAIASVTGGMVPGEFDNCIPYRSTPIMEIHGTADPTVPYLGAAFISEPTEDVVNFWVEKNGCPTDPVISDVEDINAFDQCTAERWDYLNCLEDSEVVLYKIDGGGHTWPGALFNFGVTNQDFIASDEIWNFFNRFDINGSFVSSTSEEIELVDFQLFPNPAQDYIVLKKLPLDIENIKIMDSFGTTVQTISSFQNNEITIQINDLPKGIYWLSVYSEKAKGTTKFMKF